MMMPGDATSQPEPVVLDPENVSGRPDHIDVIQSLDRPIPETAVLAPPQPEFDLDTINERRPDVGTVYITLSPPSPETLFFCNRFAHAYITPSTAAAEDDDEEEDYDDPAAAEAVTIRDAIHAALPGVEFDLLPLSYGADRTVQFLTPDDRDDAIEKQPFAALPNGDGVFVRLLLEKDTPGVRRVRLKYIVHVALLDYPKEQRNGKDIDRNCCNFGRVLQVDPACYAAPDMSPVGVVVTLHHPREIPREVRIRYSDFVIPPCLRYRHVVPVQIQRIWAWDDESGHYLDANGEKYVPAYNNPAAVAPAAAAPTTP